MNYYYTNQSKDCSAGQNEDSVDIGASNDDPASKMFAGNTNENELDETTIESGAEYDCHSDRSCHSFGEVGGKKTEKAETHECDFHDECQEEIPAASDVKNMHQEYELKETEILSVKMFFDCMATLVLISHHICKVVCACREYPRITRSKFLHTIYLVVLSLQVLNSKCFVSDKTILTQQLSGPAEYSVFAVPFYSFVDDIPNPNLLYPTRGNNNLRSIEGVAYREDIQHLDTERSTAAGPNEASQQYIRELVLNASNADNGDGDGDEAINRRTIAVIVTEDEQALLPTSPEDNQTFEQTYQKGGHNTENRTPTFGIGLSQDGFRSDNVSRGRLLNQAGAHSLAEISSHLSSSVSVMPTSDDSVNLDSESQAERSNTEHSYSQSDLVATNRRMENHVGDYGSFSMASQLSSSVCPVSPSYEISLRETKMSNTFERQKTFDRRWPHSHLNANQMAEAGLYYMGYGDKTKCFYCGVCVHQWEEGDDPLFEHIRLSPECNYAQRQIDQHRSRDEEEDDHSTRLQAEGSLYESLESEGARVVLSEGFARTDVARAVADLLIAGRAITSYNIKQALLYNQARRR